MVLRLESFEKYEMLLHAHCKLTTNLLTSIHVSAGDFLRSVVCMTVLCSQCFLFLFCKSEPHGDLLILDKFVFVNVTCFIDFDFCCSKF